jgi:Ca2+:H+ antiporter
VSLFTVVFLAKSLSSIVEATVLGWGAPLAVIGIIIASLVLMPESLAALRAARANRIQTSLNLALGSALATIGLTIPGVALISLIFDLPLTLGLTAKSEVLLVLSLFVGSLSLATGRTTVLQGAIHLVLLGVYVFTTVIP